MQTQCPHCDTKFRVTETQVQAADGFVRCGVCSEVFNAIEVASQDKHQVSLLEDVAAKESATKEQTAAVTEENENVKASTIIEASTIEVLPDDAAVNFNESTSADESGKDPFDFFNEDSNESLQHVVPEKFRDSYSSQTPSTASTALWSIGILLLTATLIIEYTWFNREQLNKVPELQGAINALCQQFECKSFSIRDPANIELITRNVFSHPNEKGALMVNVTMQNNATFAQPYPVIQIDFSDIRGNSVAARRFWPKEYLTSEYLQANAEQPNLLPANTSASISLEIQDPGKQAMTYEFNFL